MTIFHSAYFNRSSPPPPPGQNGGKVADDYFWRLIPIFFFSEVCSLVSGRWDRIFATLGKGGDKPENTPVSSKKAAYHLTKQIDLYHPHKSSQFMSETINFSRPWTTIYIYIYIYIYITKKSRSRPFATETRYSTLFDISSSISWKYNKHHRTLLWSLTDVAAWMSNNSYDFMWHMITCACINFNSG